MKRLLNILLIISITLMAVLFATLNDTRVVLNLLFWQPTEQSLASWLLISFLLGLCIGGLLVYLNMWFSLRRKIRSQRQQQSRHPDNEEEPTKPQPDRESPAAIVHD